MRRRRRWFWIGGWWLHNTINTQLLKNFYNGYFFYLDHPEGVGLSFLRGKKEELYKIYGSLSSLGDLFEMRKRIDDITNITSNSAAEKISKIKAAFVKAIGEELAQHYYIQGGYEEAKKVVLDRGMVDYSIP